jgi:hypothetical protein
MGQQKDTQKGPTGEVRELSDNWLRTCREGEASSLRFVVLFICLVCIYDIHCTVKYADTLIELERNIIAKIMISSSGENVDVSRLVTFKCLGLLAAADILEWMIRKNTRSSRLVIYTIAVLQTILLLYLVS